jgi:DNA polymerase III delta prime subunit
MQIKMNIEARKIEFIQEFLKVQSEDVISRLEKILRKENNTSDENKFEQMTEEELNKRIDQSESDFRNNRFKSSSELLSKYE